MVLVERKILEQKERRSQRLPRNKGKRVNGEGRTRGGESGKRGRGKRIGKRDWLVRVVIPCQVTGTW
jgi:hypothetical protein